jgi:LmbE family N-acetylglucosaminyl deacetylase
MSRTGFEKRGLRVTTQLAFLVLWAATALMASVARADYLVIAPHPDDDIITSAGVIYRARQAGVGVWVMYMTNGDYYPTGTTWGRQRADEAVAGEALLGVPTDHLVFLGYPDESLQNLFGATYRSTPYVPATDPQNATDAQIQANRQNQSNVTYTRTGSVPYSQTRTGAAVVNTGNNVIADLVHFLNARRPTDIFTVNENERNPDHRTTYAFLLEALTMVASYNPTVHRTAVWDDQTVWPPAPDPTQYFPQMPPARQSRGDWGVDLPWGERESLDVPLVMQLVDYSQNLKAQAVNAHHTQGGFTGVKDGGHISSFVHKDEFFWTARATGSNRPPVPNAGLDQTASVGSTVTLNGSGSLAIDADALSYAWRQSDGPSVTLSSASAVGPSFTMPNAALGSILAFELKVSDGTSTSVPDAVSVRVVAAPPDAGTDSGTPSDSGVSNDAGVSDAGSSADAATQNDDAGQPDGSADSGSPNADASAVADDAGVQLADADTVIDPELDAALDDDADAPLDAEAMLADADSEADAGAGEATSAWPGDESFEQDVDPVADGDVGTPKVKKKNSGCSLVLADDDDGTNPWWTGSVFVFAATLLHRRRALYGRAKA